MYSDNSLIPSEAVRLLALGLLASGEKGYSQVIREVRHFTGHVAGPSLDLVAPPLELLEVEGLIDAGDASGTVDPEVLKITKAGRKELIRLLSADVRAPFNDINRLIIALNLRFLHLLPPAEQRLQVKGLVKVTEQELTQLKELRARHRTSKGYMAEWLDHRIAESTTRLDWFRQLGARLASESVLQLTAIRAWRAVSWRVVGALSKRLLSGNEDLGSVAIV